MNENIGLALQLALILTQQAQKYMQLVSQANSEGRDVSDSEMNTASADYASAHKQLDDLLAGK